MLAYLASEDPERVDTTQTQLPNGQTWPACRVPPRMTR
jgi:hypothetical protein